MALPGVVEILGFCHMQEKLRLRRGSCSLWAVEQTFAQACRSEVGTADCHLIFLPYVRSPFQKPPSLRRVRHSAPIHACSARSGRKEFWLPETVQVRAASSKMRILATDPPHLHCVQARTSCHCEPSEAKQEKPRHALL